MLWKNSFHVLTRAGIEVQRQKKCKFTNPDKIPQKSLTRQLVLEGACGTCPHPGQWWLWLDCSEVRSSHKNWMVLVFCLEFGAVCPWSLRSRSVNGRWEVITRINLLDYLQCLFWMVRGKGMHQGEHTGYGHISDVNTIMESSGAPESGLFWCLQHCSGQGQWALF